MVDPLNTQPRDLIGDIHAQQRRKLFRRVALGVALFLILLLIAFALKTFADRRDRDACLDDAKEGFSLGTSADLTTVATDLGTCLGEHEADPLLMGALALTRAQLLAEFGESGDEAHAAVTALDQLTVTTHDGELARVMLALDDGELASARERLPTVKDMDDSRSIAPNHEVWVGGMLAIADPEADLDDAIDAVTAALPDDGSISTRRLLATLHMHAGDPSAALAQLEDARSRSQAHLGLAADEALYNAQQRQKLAGVATVADQLLGAEFESEIAQRDHAHALLARGVVRVQSGEIEEGMKSVDAAWAALPGWDKLSRTLALEMAMEAGDGEHARKWIDEAGLRAPESEIYEAWVKLVEGDVMSALEDLAKLPQKHPRVALLQGLALVEQNRFEEAAWWLDHADKMLPGRIDVEVARARVEAHTGDPSAARRKLEALAEEEPYAPRAWTGLGEVNLAVANRDLDPAKPDAKPDADALREARRAFKKAVERERMPAEAYLHLAELTDAKRPEDPKLVGEVLELFAKAVAANPKLPRYAEREALYLAEIGFRRRAIPKLEVVLDLPGTSAKVPLALAELALQQLEFEELETLPETFDGWLEEAKKRGASGRPLELLEARALLEREQPKDALALLDKLLEADEDDIDARVYAVRAHMDLRDRDTALDVVKRGLGTLPDELKGRIFYEWANIMSRGGKRKAAANYVNNGWKKLSNQLDVTPVQYLLLGAEAIRLLNRDKQPKPASGVGRDLTELVPYHSDAWVIRADAEIKTNRGSDAKASAEKAVELDDQNARAHDILGQVWLRFGRKDEAKASFEKAVELGKGTPREKDYRKNLEGL